MSDRDTWPDNPNDLPVEARRSVPRAGWSGCFKVFLIVGGLGFLTMVVCCGGFGWLAYRSIPKVVTTPAEVAAVAQKIMKLDIPDDFAAESGATIENPLLEMRFATFRHKQQKGMLLLGAFQVKVGDPELHKDHFQAQSTEQSRKYGKMDILKMQTREFTVRGQKVPFRFSQAEEQETKKKVRLVEGRMDAPGGGLIFVLMLEEDAYDEASVVKLIESIK